MKLMAVRRVQIAQTGKSDVPLPPAPPPHPGYAPNAALHAIKRHAVEFASPKENAVRSLKLFIWFNFMRITLDERRERGSGDKVNQTYSLVDS